MSDGARDARIANGKFYLWVGLLIFAAGGAWTSVVAQVRQPHVTPEQLRQVVTEQKRIARRLCTVMERLQIQDVDCAIEMGAR